MPRTPIVPDSKIVCPPFESDLRIVILSDKVEKVLQDEIGLVLGDAVDSLSKAFVDVHGLPSCHSCKSYQ